jgi:hypothetical protein
VIQASRIDGKIRVFSRDVPGLSESAPTPLPFRDVLALGCVDGGRRLWAAGHSGDTVTLISIRGTDVDNPVSTRGAVAFSGSHAYLAWDGRIRIYSLVDASWSTVRHAGRFEQLSVRGRRIVGRLTDGRGAVLSLATGRLRTGVHTGTLTWLKSNRVLDAAGGMVYDAKLRPVRGVSVSGELLAVEDGAAYFGDGAIVRRLAPGASRVTSFARLPGRVVALTSVRATAGAAWHSCPKSAKLPLTT